VTRRRREFKDLRRSELVELLEVMADKLATINTEVQEIWDEINAFLEEED